MTITVTCGSDIIFFSESLIWSSSCTGVSPLALISPNNGSEIIPSGRTGTDLRHLGLFPDVDRQHVIGADDVAIRPDLCNPRGKRVGGRRLRGVGHVFGRLRGVGRAPLVYLGWRDCLRPALTRCAPRRPAEPARLRVKVARLPNARVCEYMTPPRSGLLGLIIFFVFARGTGAPLRDPYFLELIEQRAIADIERARRLLSVPVISMKCIKNNTCFQFADGLPGQLLEGNRSIQHQTC